MLEVEKIYYTREEGFTKKHQVFLLFSILMFTISLTFSSPVAALVAMSESIDVFDLPQAPISSIDAGNGIIYLSAENIDPEISADLHAVVTVKDINGDVLETAQVKVIVSDPDDVIMVPLKIKLEKEYEINTKFINNELHGSETGKSIDTKWDVPSSGGSGGGSGGETVYIVTEATREEVIIEKIVEVEKPVHIDGAASSGNENREATSGYDGEENTNARPDLPDGSTPTENVEGTQGIHNMYSLLLLGILIGIAITFIAVLIVRRLFQNSGKKQKSP